MDEDGHPIARTGILKFGKYWKNGDVKKIRAGGNHGSDGHRRSVRFSGRDEYTLVDSNTFDEQAAITKLITPGLRELSILLGKDQWQVDLGSTAADQRHYHHHMDIPEPPPEPRSQPLDPSQLEDEHIGESMRRYEEMRRRLAAGEGRDGNRAPMILSRQILQQLKLEFVDLKMPILLKLLEEFLGVTARYAGLLNKMPSEDL